jgi:hypothetical protein
MYSASSRAKSRRVPSCAIRMFAGSGMPRPRYTLAIASAASSIAFTSTPRRSAQSATCSSWKSCRSRPYTSPM